MLKDQVLVGRKAFAKFLGVDMYSLCNIDRYVGIPHAIIGNRWFGTTHTVMAWLTRLVEQRFVVRTWTIDPTAEEGDGDYLTADEMVAEEVAAAACERPMPPRRLPSYVDPYDVPYSDDDIED